MYKISITIQGLGSLLCNRFSDEAAEKASAGTSTAITSGRKGTPREQAEPKLYLTSEGKPMIPGPNIFSGIIQAGIYHKAGRKQVTTGTSSLVPAGVALDEIECELYDPTLKPLKWEVDSRAVVNAATRGRMMCHRPRFDSWALDFTLSVDERMFDEKIMRLLVDDFGTKVGLGDFRPARKGPFGRHTVTSWVIGEKIKKAA